jgi:hypothetical protein
VGESEATFGKGGDATLYNALAVAATMQLDAVLPQAFDPRVAVVALAGMVTPRNIDELRKSW